jgi:hypothetical protein
MVSKAPSTAQGVESWNAGCLPWGWKAIQERSCCMARDARVARCWWSWWMCPGIPGHLLVAGGCHDWTSKYALFKSIQICAFLGFSVFKIWIFDVLPHCLPFQVVALHELVENRPILVAFEWPLSLFLLQKVLAAVVWVQNICGISKIAPRYLCFCYADTTNEHHATHPWWTWRPSSPVATASSQEDQVGLGGFLRPWKHGEIWKDTKNKWDFRWF